MGLAIFSQTHLVTLLVYVAQTLLFTTLLTTVDAEMIDKKLLTKND
jgi:hypothetical protein